MAKYTINHTCGHESTQNFAGGNPRLRQWKIEQAEAQICWECQKAEQAENAKENAEAFGLPALVGSDKQVAWAMTIRQNVLIIADQVISEYVTKLDGQDAAKVAPVKALLKKVYEGFANETAAKFWIDNRNDLWQMRIDTAVREALVAARDAQTQPTA